MKKLKYILLGFVIGALIAAVGLVALYYATRGDVDWSAYVEDVLLPNAVTAGTTLGIIGIGVSPYLKRMLEGVSGFFSATEKVNITAERGEESRAEIQASREEFLAAVGEMRATLEERLVGMSAEITALKGEVATEFKRVECELDGACKMLGIGFGCMDELVGKGSARKIKEIEEECVNVTEKAVPGEN